MDSVDSLIESLKNDSDVRNTYFSGGLLNNVGEMCSRYGYGAVKVYLLGRKRDEEQAKVLLKILAMVKDKKVPKEIGTLIFKKLNAIKHSKGGK